MLEVSAILAAGVWAGAINVIVGSGTLVTFPVLLLFGYPPLVANISNNVGIVAGGVSGVYGYRRELAGTRQTLKALTPASAAGALSGATLLLVLPPDVFQTIVPVLIAAGLLMVVAGPAIQRRTSGIGKAHSAGRGSGRRNLITAVGVFAISTYGGYFGAAQGILMFGLLSMSIAGDAQRINGIKNVLTTVVGAIAAIVFMIVAWDQIDWRAAGLIAIGTAIGGLLGARLGRRLSPTVLKAVIVIVGTAAIGKIILFD